MLGKKRKLALTQAVASKHRAATDFGGKVGSGTRAGLKLLWDGEDPSLPTPASSSDSPLDPVPEWEVVDTADEWAQRRGRGTSATLHRRGHTRNAGGPHPPLRTLPCIRLKGCTYAEDCDTCAQLKDGDLIALREQRKACRNEGMADRKLRFFYLGDWLSIAAPAGIGGPTSTYGCMYCLSKLHCTCIAGLPALPEMPVGVVDTRPALHRHPPYRAGSASVKVQSSRLAADRAVHEANPTPKRKPEPADYDSCLHPPLYEFDHPITSFGCTTLHYSLGVGNDLFRAHEETMKGYDAHLSSTLGLAESDELIMEELEELLRTAADLSAELVSAQNSRLHHQNSMRVIELTPGASDGVVKALRRRTKRSLPFEEEYREHRESLAKIEKRVEACGRKSWRECSGMKLCSGRRLRASSSTPSWTTSNLRACTRPRSTTRILLATTSMQSFSRVL